MSVPKESKNPKQVVGEGQEDEKLKRRTAGSPRPPSGFLQLTFRVCKLPTEIGCGQEVSQPVMEYRRLTSRERRGRAPDSGKKLSHSCSSSGVLANVPWHLRDTSGPAAGKQINFTGADSKLI